MPTDSATQAYRVSQPCFFEDGLKVIAHRVVRLEDGSLDENLRSVWLILDPDAPPAERERYEAFIRTVKDALALYQDPEAAALTPSSATWCPIILAHGAEQTGKATVTFDRFEEITTGLETAVVLFRHQPSLFPIVRREPDILNDTYQVAWNLSRLSLPATAPETIDDALRDIARRLIRVACARVGREGGPVAAEIAVTAMPGTKETFQDLYPIELALTCDAGTIDIDLFIERYRRFAGQPHALDFAVKGLFEVSPEAEAAALRRLEGAALAPDADMPRWTAKPR